MQGVQDLTVDWVGEKKLAIVLTENKGPRHGDTKTLALPGGVPMEMIYVAPGSFVMGSPVMEEGRNGDETQHHVALTKGYWLGKYEVTQRQWEAVMGCDCNRSSFGGLDRPVENVSWEDCREFIEKLNQKTNCGARLPTEAEWEYACRAGTSTPYSWGNSLNGDNANCDGNWPYGTARKGSFKHGTVGVGSYSPNDWGFYDMHGNVLEWCQDWYGEDYCVGVPMCDPEGPASGGRRVLRGGSWYDGAVDCRSANRNRCCLDEPGGRYGIHGFRLACSAELRE